MSKKTINFSIEDYIFEYNNLLSKAFCEHKGKFQALACPTFNKEETVTLLYKTIIDYINSGKKGIKRVSVMIRIEFIIRLFYMLYKLIITSIIFRTKTIPKNCFYIRTWLIPRSINRGKVVDDYFKQLIFDLSKSYNVVVGFQPLGYGRILHAYSKSIKPSNYINPIGMLSIIDILKIFTYYIKTAKIHLKKTYIYKGVDVSALINYSLKLDYYKLRSFQAYVELFIAKRIKTFEPSVFLYMFENQAWENSYLFTFKGTKIKTIGYQSSGFSYRFLNFFPTKLDAVNSLFPGKLLTVGDMFTKLFNKYGNYPIPIHTFAALRFNYPISNGRYVVETPVLDIHNRLLYAFPSHYYQYKIIIKDLIDILGDTEIEVHLKFHPLFSDKKFNFKLPNNFTITDKLENKSLKQKYDIVLFNDNSFGLESLLMGVRSYEYQFGEIYPEDRLLEFDLYNHRVNKKDLLQMRNDILNKSVIKYFDKVNIQKYIQKNYKVYDTNNNYYFK